MKRRYYYFEYDGTIFYGIHFITKEDAETHKFAGALSPAYGTFEKCQKEAIDWFNYYVDAGLRARKEIMKWPKSLFNPKGK